ncbi:MAG: hypothetical protein ACRDP6_27650, partial [Actinoallomurus sp.]
MNVLDRLAERPAIAAGLGLGVVFVTGLATEADIVAGYHGAWGFDLAVGALLSVAALLRERSRAWA